MTETTLIILIFCIGVPIIIATVILIRKGLEESNLEADTEMINAFLAGLKAGRPKWHKVADVIVTYEDSDRSSDKFFEELEALLQKYAI